VDLELNDWGTANWGRIAVDHAFHKFASKFIPIRAFHKAISRSCVLLRSNTSRLRQRWKIIPLLAHVSRPTGLIQGKASATTRKEMERAKKKKDVGSSSL